MGDCKRGEFWFRPKSLSKRLLFFMVPLILVSGFVIFGGSKSSKWGFSSLHYPTTTSAIQFPSSQTVGLDGADGPVLSPRERASPLELQPTIVVGGVGDDSLEKALSEDPSVLSRSSSPPLAVEVIQTHAPPPQINLEEEILNTTIIESNVLPNVNDSSALPPIERLPRNQSNLERIEARLGQARAAIREAKNGGQLPDPDYTPMGPMYWNANAFHRSYLEMEKQLKVFVYEEGEPPIFHNGPCKSIYAMEGNFIYTMETSNFRTRDPEEVQLYFLPISMTAIVRFIYNRGSADHWHPMKRTVSDYVDLISTKYPYWNRSGGADHFLLACHDWGPELSSSVPELFKNSIRALCNANTSEGFKPSKDVSFPEILLPGGTTTGLIGGPSASRRPYLVFFAGGLHGPIRPILLQHWENNKDEDVQIHRYLPKGVSYYGMMRKSKFCICPSGYEVASPRMVEALYTGCVPVLIKDGYVPPFSDVLNWKSFSVQIPTTEIPNMKRILSGISSRQYIRMQRRGVQVRRHFEVNLPPRRYDVFHMILHSVWLRRLNFRVHGVEEW